MSQVLLLLSLCIGTWRPSRGPAYCLLCNMICGLNNNQHVELEKRASHPLFNSTATPNYVFRQRTGMNLKVGSPVICGILLMDISSNTTCGEVLPHCNWSCEYIIYIRWVDGYSGYPSTMLPLRILTLITMVISWGYRKHAKQVIGITEGKPREASRE